MPSLANPAKQLPFYMGSEVTMNQDMTGPFCVLGLFGNGPDYLPTAIKEVTKDSESSKTDTKQGTYSFTLNSNGTIHTEAYNGKAIAYGYSATRADVSNLEDIVLSIRNLNSKLFRRRK